MLIRSATADDVPAVLPLVRALCDLHASADPDRFAVRPDVLDRYSAWLPERARDPRSVFLVAEAPGVLGLAGFVVCTIEPEVPIFWVPECGWIHDLYVVPAARRHGTARALVREVVSRYSSIGVKQLRLHTGTFNDIARKAFAAEGFRPCVVEMLRML
ncbi:MAG: N-acetyltransferase family protein [Phycisphaerales bacterium]